MHINLLLAQVATFSVTHEVATRANNILHYRFTEETNAGSYAAKLIYWSYVAAIRFFFLCVLLASFFLKLDEIFL